VRGFSQGVQYLFEHLLKFTVQSPPGAGTCIPSGDVPADIATTPSALLDWRRARTRVRRQVDSRGPLISGSSMTYLHRAK
jgi:hypothetical protein